MKGLMVLLCVFLSACSVPHLKPQHPALGKGSRVFDPSYSGFDKGSVLFAAGIANASYEYDPLTVRNALMSDPRYRMTCVDLVFLAGTDRRVLITSRDDFAFVAINGSETAKDWYNDAKYLSYASVSTVTGPYAGLPPGHGGFRHMYAAARAGVSAALKHSPCMGADIKSVYFSGHSLGAALGIIAAKVLCQDDNICFSGMFLFAPPLTVPADVFEDARAYRKDRIISVQNYKDYISRAGLRGTFAPPGRFYVLEDGRLEERPESQKFVKYTWLEKLRFKLAEDHRMKNYISDIEALP